MRRIRFRQSIGLVVGLGWPSLRARTVLSRRCRLVTWGLISLSGLAFAFWVGSTWWSAHFNSGRWLVRICDGVLEVCHHSPPGRFLAKEGLQLSYSDGGLFSTEYRFIRHAWGTQVSLPIWNILTVCLGLSSLWILICANLRTAVGRCGFCGYEMRGIENTRGGGKCPECGWRQRHPGGIAIAGRVFCRLWRRVGVLLSRWPGN